MSYRADDTQAASGATGTPNGEERRVRKGGRLRERRSRTEPADGDTQSLSGSTRKREVSEEASSDVSDAKRQRLLRREERKAKRLQRSEERKASLPEKPEVLENATDEEKEAHAEELSVAKLRRETRRKDRAKRREERAKIRAEASKDLKKSDALSSSKEKLAGLFGENAPSEKPQLDKTDTDTDYSENIDPNESQNNIDPPLSENSKLGTETIGAGQIAQPLSHSKRIADKLEQAAKENNENKKSAKDRLNRVLKGVTSNTSSEIKAEKNPQAKKAAKEKKLSTQEKFKAGLERALIEGLQKTGKEVNTFQALEMTATNSKYASDVEKLQKRATTSSIRIITEENNGSSVSKISAEENVGLMFNKNRKKGKPPQGQENTPPFSKNIHFLMTALQKNDRFV